MPPWGRRRRSGGNRPFFDISWTACRGGEAGSLDAIAEPSTQKATTMGAPDKRISRENISEDSKAAFSMASAPKSAPFLKTQKVLLLHHFKQLKIFIFLCMLTRAMASSGDESRSFQTCVGTCTRTGCATTDSAILGSQTGDDSDGLSPQIRCPPNATVPCCSPLCLDVNQRHSPSFVGLTLMHWDCRSDCLYRCMWLLEDSKHLINGRSGAMSGSTPRKVEKYFGKWPFIRLFGAQEPASVAFSLLNLSANAVSLVLCMRHIYSILKATSRISSSPHGYAVNDTKMVAWLWPAHFLVSCNAWAWSAVFHCRDTRFTERLDYFSAGALVAFNLFITLVRVSGLRSAFGMVAMGVPLFVVYLRHILYMHHVLFDYGYHVALCVGAGALQTLAWGAWALGSRRGKSHPGRAALLTFMALVNVAMLLEVLDFPPWKHAIDAHAVWHAATAPLTLLWYKFVRTDLVVLLQHDASSAHKRV